MENKLGSAAEGGHRGALLRWSVLPEIVTRTKHVFHSFFRTMQVRAVLFWALPKAAWRATSSKKLEGNTKFLGADEEISSDHRRRDAAAPVQGTGGQRSLFSKGKQRKWDVFFSKGKLQRENQLWPFATPRDSGATQPSKNVPLPCFASLPEEVMSKERAETDLCGQAVATKFYFWMKIKEGIDWYWSLDVLLTELTLFMPHSEDWLLP